MRTPRRVASIGGLAYGGRAVVKLQVEEDFTAAAANLAHEVGSAVEVERLADLEHPDHARQFVDQSQRLGRRPQVERHNQPFAQRAMADQA